MSWKRVLPVISIAAMVGAFSSNLISVNIGDKTGEKYLSSLKNFDWKDSTFGDGFDYNNKNDNARLDDNSNIAQLINANINNIVKSQNVGSYLDYSKFSTGFKINDDVAKQAVTGVPLNWGFMPNGNFASDFGVTSKAQKNRNINSILDWSPSSDKDSRYNRSYVPLRNSADTAFMYPDSANGNPTKNKEMKFDYMGYSTRKQSSFDNSVVGVKNPFEGTNLNWQYTSTFINWSGSSISGIIVPPPADMVSMAHNNGVPIYGNVFLDGGHGLTKEMLRDFIKKDSDGNYYIVDILLALAEYEGFDGYFFNDESNGGDPNGTVLDYQTVVTMVKQFNEKSLSEKLNKKILFYTAGGNLMPTTAEQETYDVTKTMPNGEPQDVALGFGYLPDTNQYFLDHNKNYKPNNIYSLYDAGWKNYIYGTYDWRQLGYQVDHDIVNNHIKYNKNVYGSMGGFMNGGSIDYAQSAMDMLGKSFTGSNKNTPAQNFMFANQVSNLFNDIFFNGLNTNPSYDDNGLAENENSPVDNYGSINPNSNVTYEYVLNDPRIKWAGKSDLKPADSDSDIKSRIYNFANNNGKNKNSYGVGNAIQERTVFEDIDNKDTSISTNFSTGSGIKFVDRDDKGDAIITNNYPYANRRIADIMPTYQWDVNEIPAGSESSIGQIDPLSTPKTDIRNINGFYDYDDVYRKSNSITLGGYFDQTGSVQDAKWDTNKDYIWNIMGTNLSSNHKFSIAYKSGDKNQNNADVKPIITITNQNTGKSQYVIPKVLGNDAQTTNDGWEKLSFDLSGLNISSDNKVSKIGLLVTPKNSDFKFNVGEFSMDEDQNINSESNSAKMSDFTSEYRIQRGDLSNLRFNYKIDSDFDYVEFYIKGVDDKWYRVGETNADEYFIKDISEKDFGKSLNLSAVIYKNNKVVGSSNYEID